MSFSLPNKSTIAFKNKFINILWSFFNVYIFPLTFRSHYIRRKILILFGANIADNARISNKCKIEYPFNLSLGNNSSIGSNCYIQALDKITIGSNVCVSDNVSILTGTHDLESEIFELVTSPIIILDNVWLSYGCCVLPGVTIKYGAIVGAKSLVTKDVDSLSVVGGNPSKFIKKRKRI